MLKQVVIVAEKMRGRMKGRRTVDGSWEKMLLTLKIKMDIEYRLPVRSRPPKHRCDRGGRNNTAKKQIETTGQTGDGAEAEIDLESQLSFCEGGDLHFKVAACLGWNCILSCFCSSIDQVVVDIIHERRSCRRAAGRSHWKFTIIIEDQPACNKAHY